MVYCFLADGFEELEAVGAVDMLKRADINVKLVGVTGQIVTGAHGIKLVSDCSCDEVILDASFEAVMLPGGMPGTLNLEKSEAVQKAIDFAVDENKLICAICAAPQILGHKGILEGRCAIAYPGFEKELKGAKVSSDYVVTDGNFITAKGAGVAADFGLAVVSALKGEELASNIKASIQAR